MKKLLLLAILPVFTACNGHRNKTVHSVQNDVLSISRSQFGGGKAGYYESIEITNDSIYFNQILAIDTAKNKNGKKLNTKYKLENLVSKDELGQLDTIKNGKTEQDIDGIDTQITVKTTNKTYKITNAGNNELWSRIVTQLYKISIAEFGKSY